jgi:hypothetical protein
MTNPRLTKDQREKLFTPLLSHVKDELQQISSGDAQLLWALRRKLTKELGYLERGTPLERTKLKEIKWQAQKGLCALCGEPLPKKNSELDRYEAYLGYREANVRLVHHKCHVKDQEIKKYT